MSAEFVKLAGVGQTPAKKASEFRVGESILMSYGYKRKIIDKKLFLENNTVRFVCLETGNGNKQIAVVYDGNKLLAYVKG